MMEIKKPSFYIDIEDVVIEAALLIFLNLAIKKNLTISYFGYYGQFDLNRTNPPESIVHQLEEGRKLMVCARKGQRGIVTAIFPDRHARARNITVDCVK
jgi:hypothetical protein